MDWELCVTLHVIRARKGFFYFEWLIRARKGFFYFECFCTSFKEMHNLYGEVVNKSTNNRNNELTDLINEMLEKPDTICKLFTDCETAKIYNTLLSDLNNKFIPEDEKLADIRRSIDKSRRSDVIIAQFLIHFLSVDFTDKVNYWLEVFQKFNSIEIFNEIEMLTFLLQDKENGHYTKESLTNFFLKLPVIDVYYHLQLFMMENTQRQITHNDYFDIQAIASTIPHCDVVLIDRFYSERCNQKKLNEKYDTMISHKISDLDKYLDEL
jgi:hypothetical protein